MLDDRIECGVLEIKLSLEILSDIFCYFINILSFKCWKYVNIRDLLKVD